MDADGDGIVVWERDDGDTTEIQTRAALATGGFGPVHTLSGPGENGETPDVATSPAGDSIAVWRRAPSAGGPIEARAISAGGTLGPLRRLSAKKAVAPQLAIDAEGDSIAVWHRDSRDADFHAVEARMVSASGDLGPVWQLSPHGARGRGAKVATDADGDSLVVWRNNVRDQVDGRTISATGERGPVERLSPHGVRARSPEVSVDEDGDATVVWTAFENPDETFVQARHISIDGVLGPIVTVSDPDQPADFAQVATEPGGGSPIVFQASDGASTWVARRFFSAQDGLRLPQTISGPGDVAVRPELAVDADGNTLAIWQVEPHNRIEARTVYSDEALGPIRPVAGAATPTQPRIAAGAGGDALVAWQRFDGADNRVQAARGPVAPADPGRLVAGGCIDDIQTGRDVCLESMDGLAGATSVAVSADGESVYAAGGDDDAVVRLDRDPATGELIPRNCIGDNTSMAACSQVTRGFRGVTAITVSPDGTSVYAVSNGDDAVILLDRNPDTGAITPIDCISDNQSGSDLCAKRTRGLSGAGSVAVSADGQSVYVASRVDDALVQFQRNTSTGTLTSGRCVEDVSTREPQCSQSTEGLDGANSVTVSPDGRSVYVASGGNQDEDDALVRFNRDTTTGTVTPAGCIEDDNDDGVCAEQAAGLDGATYVTGSADGTSIYVASDGDNAAVRFDRDPAAGALTAEGCVEDINFGRGECAQSTEGLRSVSSAAVSSDGRSVYTTSVPGGIVRFGRDPASGALSPIGCLADRGSSLTCPQRVRGLSGTRQIALSPDGTSAYAASSTDSAIARFQRIPTE